MISGKEGATAMSISVGILRTCKQMAQPDTASIKFNHFQMFDMGKKVEHIPYKTREEVPPVPIKYCN